MKINHPTIIICTLFLFFSIKSLAQNNSISGAVTDTSGMVLPAATIALMEAQDSVLASFGMTDNEGRFELKRVAPGDYLLQVTYVGFDTYWQAVKLSAGSGHLNLGPIQLSQRNATLEEVQVTAEHIPLSMRNDTLVYNADAFKTQPGSVVEDLLKKLPGVEVERDGTIKAQGETVQSVYVDGKEFFGNDPKIATKNLPADAVDKVQVYDKKSDMAEFTGIEDGRDSKSINLELKDGKKNGYFGNAALGGGVMEDQEGDVNYDRYEGKFNINRFSGSTQLSAIGLLNNTNQQGFSFDEYIRFMGGLSNFLSGGGGGKVQMSFDPSAMGIPMEGGGLDQGFTTTSAAGLNLNHDFGKKTKLNASYFYSSIENDLDRLATKESLLDNDKYTSNETERRISQNQNHRLNATLRHTIDSFQNIILRANMGFNKADLSSVGSTSSFTGAEELQNSNQRDYRAGSDNFSFSSNFTYRCRFHRKGRAIFAKASWGSQTEDRDGALNSQNLFYENPGPPAEENTVQSQRFTDDAKNYGLTLSYTEPLGRATKKKGQYLEFRASRQNFDNKTDKKFYDTGTGTSILNTQLSNQYNRDYLYDRGGLNLMVNRKKFNLTLGTELQNSRLTGTLLEGGDILEKNFTRLLPSMYLNYEMATSRNFDIEYQTSIQEPSLEQLQPLVDNSDPLNIYTGNPDLKPAYVHELSGNYMLFDQFTFTSLFVNFGAGYTTDPITNSTIVDSLFRQNIRPVNVDHDLLLQGGFQFRTPFRPIGTNIRLSYKGYWNQGLQFVNENQNEVERQRHSLSLSFDNRKKEVVDFTIGGRLSYNQSDYSENNALNQHYIDRKLYSDLVVLPSPKWELSSSLDYSFYSAATFGEKRSIPIWKASLTRYVLKNRRGRFVLSAYDILNKNIGINRSNQLNYFQEERIRSLGRHVMLTFAYSISGFNKESGGIEITVGKER